MKTQTEKILTRGCKAIGLIMLLAFTAFIAAAIYFLATRNVAPSEHTTREELSPQIIRNDLPIKLRWEFNSDATIIYPPHALGRVVVIKVSNSRPRLTVDSTVKFMALDALTGGKVWDVHFTGLIEDIPPIALGDLLITPVEAEYQLRALNVNTGQLVFETEKESRGPVRGLTNGTPTLLGSRGPIRGLTTDGEVIYVGSGIEPTRIYAIDAMSGKVIWTQSDRLPAKGVQRLIMNDSRLYSIFTSGIFVLNPKTGLLIAKNEIFIQSFDRPAYQNGVLFTNAEERVVAFDMDSGQTLWSFSPECIKNKKNNAGLLQQMAGRFSYAPSPLGESVYITGGCGTIFALDTKTGKTKWQYNSGADESVSYLAELGGVGYAMFSDGSVRAIDLDNGTEKGQFKIAPTKLQWETNAQGLAAGVDMLYVTFGDKVVYAFGK